MQKNSDICQKMADTFFFLIGCKKLKKSEEQIGLTPGDRPEGRFGDLFWLFKLRVGLEYLPFHLIREI